MNKNSECDIVKDLSSLYIENILSESSMQFVTNHINECKDCEKYYKVLNSNFLDDNDKEKKEDEIEINHLKKVNKKIAKLKWILTTIIALILIICIYFYCRIYYIDNINNLTISKIENMMGNSNNYKLVHVTEQINKLTNEKNIIKVEHYYKDGKHKEVVSYEQNGEIEINSILFIEDNKYEKTTVFPSLKQIDHQKQDFIEVRKGDTLKPIISNVMLNDAGIHHLGLKARLDSYHNQECYVVYESYNGSYRENYINKETGDLLKVVSGTDNYYCEETYTLTENIVKDEEVDINILENEEYKDYKINNLTYKLPDFMEPFYN